MVNAAKGARACVPKCCAGRALQPTSDEKYPRPPGFSAFGFDRRDDEVIDKRFVAAHESGCDLVDDARSLQRSPIGYSLQSNRAC